VEHDRRVRIGVELPALAAVEVGEEAEPAAVDTAEQHGACRRPRVCGHAGDDHRVRLQRAVRDRVVVPPLEGDERVRVDVGFPQRTLTGDHAEIVGVGKVGETYDAAMPFHHVAIATNDLDATHRFYTEVMGFELVHAEAAADPEQTGWARHLFYDTGNGECLAIWDLHIEAVDGFDPAISTGLGLPPWVNHVAFAAADIAALDAHRVRLVAHGYDVLELDHGWCRSIYVNDPGGTTVEFCCTTDASRLVGGEAAEELRTFVGVPPLGEGPGIMVYEGERR
jgi:catechol 2,3-dioxygenase-like lactoylglutathione lyase family enzyme